MTGLWTVYSVLAITDHHNMTAIIYTQYNTILLCNCTEPVNIHANSTTKSVHEDEHYINILIELQMQTSRYNTILQKLTKRIGKASKLIKSIFWGKLQSGDSRTYTISDLSYKLYLTYKLYVLEKYFKLQQSLGS